VTWEIGCREQNAKQMSHSKEASIISLGSSPRGRKRAQWRKVERDILEGQPNYNPSAPLFNRGHDESREFFLLSCEGEHVGRAAAVVSETDLARRKERLGFIDDFVIHPNYKHLAKLLIQRCLTMLRQSGVQEVIVRSHGFPALAAQEFEESPPSSLPCNPPWYIELFERRGFTKHKEWANFRFALPRQDASKEGIAKWEGILAGTHTQARRINVRSRKELKQYSDLVYDVLVDHYGYTPSRFMDSYSLLKHVIIATVFPIVKFRVYVLKSEDGRTIGFTSYHPDYYMAARPVIRFLKRVWFPCNALVLIPALAVYILLIRRTRKATIGAVGLAEGWRRKGFIRAIDHGFGLVRKEGYEELDSGPVLVENAVVVKMAESFAKRYDAKMERATYYTLRHTL